MGDLLDPNDPGVRELRTALWSAGYTLDTVADLLGFAGDSVSIPAGQVPVVDRQLARGGALNTLIRLFLLGIPVPATDAAAALGTLSVARCAAFGAVTVEDGHVRSTVRLLPARDVIVVCDRKHEHSADLGADHVMSVTPSTNLLADLTIRRPVDSALDMCTGGGLQALLCARHARRVVATDLNPRAVNFAAFGAALNGLDNIEFREGDMYEPVGGERFDLVVSNPPFIISPDAAYAFRDSPLEGDEISRLAVRGAAEHLKDGGLAFVLVGWAHRGERHWAEPMAGWIEGLGCDAWFLHHTTADPLDYAVGFNRPLAPLDPEGYAAAIDRWVEYDRRLGIEAIGYGAVVLRRRPGPTWIRSDVLDRSESRPAGEQVERLFAAQDLLVSLAGDDALLDLVLITNRRHRLEQVLRPGDDGYVMEKAGVVLEEGLSFRAGVDMYSAQMLLRLDGRRPLRDVLEEARTELEPDMDPARFAAASLGAMRRMIELGFVLPAG